MHGLHGFGTVLDHPAAVLFTAVVIGLLGLKYLGLSYPEFVNTTNSIDLQNRALIVLLFGFWMLVVCQSSGIDTTIAGGVIGCGVNMLTSQKPAPTPSPDPNTPK